MLLSSEPSVCEGDLIEEQSVAAWTESRGVGIGTRVLVLPASAFAAAWEGWPQNVSTSCTGEGAGYRPGGWIGRAPAQTRVQ
jgi:hypothetical protein